jgi:hypothetical protein
LLAIGAAFFVGGVFPPVRTPVVSGYLHGIAGLVAIFGSPIAFTLIGRGLARSEARILLPRSLQWATLIAWIGFWFFLVSLAVVSLTDGLSAPLSPWVSFANRFLIVTYCLWLMAAGWSAIGTRLSPTRRNS